MDKGLKHYQGLMQRNSKPAVNNRAAKRQRRLLTPRKPNVPVIPMSHLLDTLWGRTVVEEKENKVTFAQHQKECKGCMTYNFCGRGLELLNAKI